MIGVNFAILIQKTDYNRKDDTLKGLEKMEKRKVKQGEKKHKRVNGKQVEKILKKYSYIFGRKLRKQKG